MEAIDVASGKLFFEDVQPRKGEPYATLVLIHGAGGSHLSWRRQFHELSEIFRVIAIDLPGHGMSGGNGNITVNGYTQCVAELMDVLALKDVVLGGHSLGGAIALDVALRDSTRVGGLLLVGTGARLRVLPAIFSLIRQDFALAIEGVGNSLFSSEAPSELISEEKQLLAKISPNLLIKDFTACDSFDMMDKLAIITAPALIACGKEDRLTPPKYSGYLHEKLANSELVVFDNCGHMAMLEKSAEFNRCVSSFLAKLQ